MHVLNSSILNIMGPMAASWVSGHFEAHPDGRSSLKFSKALPMTPYFGEWIQGTEIIPRTVKGTEGPVSTGGIDWALTPTQAKLVEAESMEPFKRDGDIFDVTGDSDPTKMADISTWYGRKDYPEWGPPYFEQ